MKFMMKEEYEDFKDGQRAYEDALHGSEVLVVKICRIDGTVLYQTAVPERGNFLTATLPLQEGPLSISVARS